MNDEPQQGAMIADAVSHLIRRAVHRTRVEVEKAAQSGRRRMEIRARRKELDHFYVRLGKTAQQLVLAGELDHPALRKAMARIDELETELDRAASTETLATGEGAD